MHKYRNEVEEIRKDAERAERFQALVHQIEADIEKKGIALALAEFVAWNNIYGGKISWPPPRRAE